VARRVACFDIDGTLHRGTRLGYSLGECVARACVERGLAPADSFSHTEELLASYDRRQISFDSYVSAFTKKLEDGFFGGMKETEVCALAAEIAAQERERTYVFTRELLRACQSLGYCTIDWQARRAVLIEAAPAELVADVLARVAALLE
jgi:phosphoserine phosphatase